MTLNDELVIDDLISLAEKKLACDLEILNHQSIMEISRIASQLYDTLKELYEQIDHNENRELENGEFMYFEIKYSGEMQSKVRKALRDYINNK